MYSRAHSELQPQISHLPISRDLPDLRQWHTLFLLNIAGLSGALTPGVLQGVRLVIEEGPTGSKTCKRITFAKSLFTTETANIWMRQNKQEVYKRFNLQASMKRTGRSRNMSIRTMNPTQSTLSQNLLSGPSGTSEGSNPRYVLNQSAAPSVLHPPPLWKIR